MIPNARNRAASSQLCCLRASISAIPKKMINTAIFVNAGFFILLYDSTIKT